MDDALRIVREAVRVEHVIAPGSWVGNCFSRDLVRAQIKAVSHDYAIDLATGQLADHGEASVDRMAFWQDEGAMVRSTFSKRERGGSNVHLAVANKDVTVAAEATEALVLVDIGVVGVEKATMAED